MKLMDEKKLGFTTAVELSYIGKKNQNYIAVADVYKRQLSKAHGRLISNLVRLLRRDFSGLKRLPNLICNHIMLSLIHI